MSRLLPPRFVPLALALGSLALASCSTLSSGIGTVTGSTQKKEPAEKVTRIQAEVMSFADIYVGQVLDGTSKIPAPGAEEQVQLLGFQARQASAAFEIASGKIPWRTCSTWRSSSP